MRNAATAFLMISTVLMIFPGDLHAADPVTRMPGQATPSPTRALVGEAETAAADVTRAVPNRPALSPGGMVTITLYGSRMDLLRSAAALLDGQPVSTITIRLGAAAPQSRTLTLMAGPAAAAGLYRLRLSAGARTVDVPPGVLEVVVRGEATRPAALAPMTSRPAGDGVPGSAPAGDQVPGIRQAPRSAGQQDGQPAAGSDAAQNMARPSAGGPPATATRTGPVALQPGAGSTPLPAARTPSKPSASSLATRVEGMTAAPDRSPTAFEPSGPRVAVDPGDLMAQRQAGIITGNQFHRVVQEVFSGARFDANACGGSYQDRKIVTSIPDTLFEEAVGAVSRLDYELTDGEKERTIKTYERTLAADWQNRRKQIRACMDNWQGRSWTGSVSGGRLRVLIPFSGNTQTITTRAIDQSSTTASPFWSDEWSWNSEDAVRAIPDYVFARAALEVELSPRLDGELVSYGGVDARWSIAAQEFNLTPGEFRLPENRQRILDHKDATLEAVRAKIIAVFSNGSVKARVARALTDSVLANQYVNRVTALTGGDDTITYDFE